MKMVFKFGLVFLLTFSGAVMGQVQKSENVRHWLNSNKGLAILIDDFERQNGVLCRLASEHISIYDVESGKGFSAFYDCPIENRSDLTVRVVGDIVGQKLSLFKVAFLK